MIPHFKANLSALFEDSNQKVWMGSSLVIQLLSWLAENWAMAVGLFATSLIPLFISWKKSKEELRQIKRMNDLAYEEKLYELQQKKKQK